MNPQCCQSPVRPAGSRDAGQCRPGGVTLIVPPTGVRRGPHTPFVWGVMWSGNWLFWFAAVLAVALTQPDFSFLIAWPSLGACSLFLFLMLGVGMACWAFDQGRRYGVLSVQGDTLTVRTAGPFG